MKKLILVLLFLSFSTEGFAQFFKDNKNITRYDGYFTFYYDESNDKIFLEIENLDKEFLYVNALSEGIGSNDIGLDRGQLGNTRVVKFIKAGNKLLLIQPNQYYRAITNNIEEKKSVEQAFAKSSDVLSTLSKPLSGKEVKEYRLLMTNVVMSPSWIQILVGGILSLFGGEINVFTKVVDWSRREAQQRLREQAAASGYDEVINVRMETTTLSKIRGGKDKTTGIEVLAYGTGIKY